MKKACLLVATFIALTVYVNATKPSFALRYGVNISRLSELESDEGYLPGNNIGCLLQIPVSRSIIIQPEVVYTQKGELWIAPLGVVGRANELSYVEMPLLLTFNLPAGSVLFQPKLGPSLAVLLKATGYAGSLWVDENPPPVDITDSINSTDIGLNIGTDIILWRHLMLGIRYNHGLINVNKSESEEKEYNRTYTFSIGYLFGKRVE